MLTKIFVGALIAGTAAIASVPAQARDHFAVGIGIGLPVATVGFGYPGPYYRRPVYVAPPVVYGPPVQPHYGPVLYGLGYYGPGYYGPSFSGRYGWAPRGGYGYRPIQHAGAYRR